MPLTLAASIAGIVLWKRGFRRAGPALLIGAVAFLWLLSTAPIADAFLWTLEGRYEPLEAAPGGAGAIVVLGHGHFERDGFGPWASLSGPSRARVIEAIRLSRGNDLPILFTGYGGAGEISAAEINRDAAAALGVDPARLHALPEPRNTAEEAAAAAAFFAADAPARNAPLLLVTSASHMHRALMLFRREGVDAIPAPADYMAGVRSYTAWHIIPGADALESSERAWYEWMGIAWAWIRGRI